MNSIFGIINNDLRSEFFLLVLCDLLKRNLELTTENLYNSPFMVDLRNNSEWIQYCYDLTYQDFVISDNVIQDFIIQDNNKILAAFFNNNIRSKDKIADFVGIRAPVDYMSTRAIPTMEFVFNDSILNNILRKVIGNIPEYPQMKIISPIERCLNTEEKNKFTNNVMQCLKGNKYCVEMMNPDNKEFINNIEDEVNRMDICDATKLLVSFGFTNLKTDKNKFELYETWEARIKNILELQNINPNFKKYIILLLKHVDPIGELKRQITELSSPHRIKLLDTHINSPYYYMERKYHTSHYIYDTYMKLTKIFNNKIIFNYNNLALYKKMYDKIHYKYLIVQKDILNKL